MQANNTIFRRAGDFCHPIRPRVLDNFPECPNSEASILLLVPFAPICHRSCGRIPIITGQRRIQGSSGKNIPIEHIHEGCSACQPLAKLARMASVHMTD
jgi:hypothetical protein